MTHLLITQAKIDLGEARIDDAIASTEDAVTPDSPTTYRAEALAFQGLAYAARGDHGRAIELAREAETLSRAAEARVLAAFVKAAVLHKTDDPHAVRATQDA